MFRIFATKSERRLKDDLEIAQGRLQDAQRTLTRIRGLAPKSYKEACLQIVVLKNDLEWARNLVDEMAAEMTHIRPVLVSGIKRFGESVDSGLAE